jgi:fructosamine-3-kinase
MGGFSNREQLTVNELEELLAERVGRDTRIESVIPVQGGDINFACRLNTTGRPFFLKYNNIALPDMFEKEYRGLELLRETKAIRAPKPIITGTIPGFSFLVMEYIMEGNRKADFWKEFAGGLAGLHRHTSTDFGLSEDNYIGTLKQSNNRHPDWSSFYARERILPLFQLALKQEKCSAADLKLAEEFCERLKDLVPEEKPSLLHGDLWSGNFTADEHSHAVIFDPAVYYGHRETDIAMAKLFGGFDSSFYHYYNERFPLQKGWEQRVEIFQLYPLLVHLLLFGGHYHGSVMNILRKYE